MSRGFQPDPLKEHAALIELAALMSEWRKAEHDAKQYARNAIATGVRADVVADGAGMSRATLYRWLSD